MLKKIIYAILAIIAAFIVLKLAMFAMSILWNVGMLIIIAFLAVPFYLLIKKIF